MTVMVHTIRYMTAHIKKPLGVTLRGESAEFRVWAPHAKSVSVCGTFSDMQPVALASENDGNWSITLKAKAGEEYFYLIDTGSGEPLRRIDPRARSLTSSDRGMGIIADDEFDWQGDTFTPPPVNEQIIYEMHIGTFNRTDPSTPGTFNDAIEKLDYLKELGVNMIELMPIASMAFSSGWGYAPLYPFSVETTYGGRGGCMKFVRECHKRGIGVIHDVVYNHLYGDTDLWRFDGWHEGETGGGIYFYNDSRVETPWGGRPDFGRDEVRQYFADNVEMWLDEYHMDGLRIDSTIYLRNTKGFDGDTANDIPEAWTFLGELTERAKSVKPAAIMIAEDSSGNTFLTKPVSEGGCGFDAQWELGYPHGVRDALQLTPDKAPTIDTFVSVLNHTYNDNPFQKIIFSDSHDTAANGSARINQVATPRDAASLFARQTTLLASALALTGPGVPMMLQGQDSCKKARSMIGKNSSGKTRKPTPASCWLIGS